MGSSGGSANPAYLSQGNAPIPNLPIAGQGAPNDNPRNFGAFQNFLPDIPPAGQGPAPLAHGLTAEMLQYRSPQGAAVPTGGGGAVGAGAGAASAAAGGGGGGGDGGQIDQLRQQLASLQTQVNSGGNGQYGAARGPQEYPNIPLGWLNSNNPNATS